jgi:hypothetical protein
MGAGDPGSVETDVERLGDRRPADAEIDDVKATGSSGGGRENVRRKRHLLVASSCILGEGVTMIGNHAVLSHRGQPRPHHFTGVTPSRATLRPATPVFARRNGAMRAPGFW